MRDRDREKERHRQREKQAPCRKPNAGLDPGSPGSHPRLQEALNHCTTRAAPRGGIRRNILKPRARDSVTGEGDGDISLMGSEGCSDLDSKQKP